MCIYAPWRPVISNCGTPTEKVSEYLDFCLTPVMQNDWSYGKESRDLKSKIKKLCKLSGNITLATADVVTPYSIMLHEALETLRERPVKNEDLKLPVNDIVTMAVFARKKRIFEFNGKVKQQLAETAIGTKFAPSFACIYIDEAETEFLKTPELQPLVWF